RKLLDGQALSADSRAHRATRVAPDLIGRTAWEGVGSGGQVGGSVSEGGGWTRQSLGANGSAGQAPREGSPVPLRTRRTAGGRARCPLSSMRGRRKSRHIGNAS